MGKFTLTVFVNAGDEEGGIEMTTSMVLIREFCKIFGEQAPSTRIFFPDVREVESAKSSLFQGTSFKLDFLTKPSGLEDFGFSKKVRMADRAQASDKVFLVAYPYFNVNEMIAVEELHRDAAESAKRPIIVFNGELDRIRSGCILACSFSFCSLELVLGFLLGFHFSVF
jgi:hypothetical protein